MITKKEPKCNHRLSKFDCHDLFPFVWATMVLHSLKIVYKPIKPHLLAIHWYNRADQILTYDRHIYLIATVWRYFFCKYILMILGTSINNVRRFWGFLTPHPPKSYFVRFQLMPLFYDVRFSQCCYFPSFTYWKKGATAKLINIYSLQIPPVMR